MSHKQCFYYREVRIRDAGFRISICIDRTLYTFTERGSNPTGKFFPTRNFFFSGSATLDLSFMRHIIVTVVENPHVGNFCG